MNRTTETASSTYSTRFSPGVTHGSVSMTMASTLTPITLMMAMSTTALTRSSSRARSSTSYRRRRTGTAIVGFAIDSVDCKSWRV